jgi:succinate dehydrogenase / fumarate reductase membrane anchor subunit
MKQTAHNGSRHWLWQRISSVALIPLSLWIVPMFISLATAPHARAAAWLVRPWNAALTWIFVAMVCLHAALGLRVVLEDYVQHEPTRNGAIQAVNILMAVLTALTALVVAWA